jgi:hypothetical protein
MPASSPRAAPVFEGHWPVHRAGHAEDVGHLSISNRSVLVIRDQGKVAKGTRSQNADDSERRSLQQKPMPGRLTVERSMEI